jgi:transcriptional regulator with XRE-family HTH domain
MVRKPSEVHLDVGKKIAFFRLTMTKKSQEQLASDLGMSASYLCQLEGGQRNPTLDMLLSISAECKVDVGEFFKL